MFIKNKKLKRKKKLLLAKHNSPLYNNRKYHSATPEFMSDTTNYQNNMELLFSSQPSEKERCLRSKNISGF